MGVEVVVEVVVVVGLAELPVVAAAASGGAIPCILALCRFRKYLLQNSFWHRSQYASGLMIPPGFPLCCWLPPPIIEMGTEGADVVMVDGELDHNGKKSINPLLLDVNGG